VRLQQGRVAATERSYPSDQPQTPACGRVRELANPLWTLGADHSAVTLNVKPSPMPEVSVNSTQIVDAVTVS
jgi:hypothetical protein